MCPVTVKYMGYIAVGVHLDGQVHKAGSGEFMIQSLQVLILVQLETRGVIYMRVCEWVREWVCVRMAGES